MELALIALVGLVVGSFLNVVILRHMVERDVTGRSGCMTCGHTLQWFELIPVVSYLLQRGRCRACATPLSLQYPLVECATACVFLAVAVWGVPYGAHESVVEIVLYGATLTTHLAVWATLIVIFVYDLRTTYIPDIFSYTLASCAFVVYVLQYVATHTPHSLASTVSNPTELLIWFLAGPLLYAPFWALWKYSEGKWIGLGDGKLAWGMGWFLGLMGGASAIMFGVWIGAVVAIGVMGVQRARLFHCTIRNKAEQHLTLQSEIPFGPFLIIGTAIVYFTGATFVTLFL